MSDRFFFPLKFNQPVRWVSKIEETEFTPIHREVLDGIRLENNLLIPDERWSSIYLGQGEEKAVYCICDHEQHVFALEIINEKRYLNGRLVDGKYFFEMRIPHLTSKQSNADKLDLRPTYSGLIKIREFIHGYEWARFQFNPDHKSYLDQIMTDILRLVFASKHDHYQTRYKDAHDANIMFEIDQMKIGRFPVLVKDHLGKLRLVGVQLKGIDLR
jgi:hypothetical protein